MTPASNESRLGELLVERGLVTADQLHIAETDRARKGLRLGAALVGLGFVSESLLRDTLAASTNRHSVDLRNILPDPQALRRVPRPLATRFRVFPVSWSADERRLTLAVADPDDLGLFDRLGAALGGEVQLRAWLAGEGEIAEAIDRFYGHELTLDGVVREIESAERRALGEPGQTAYRQPVVRLVDAVLNDAVRQRASDIHVEPEKTFLRLRYRVDGVMRQVLSLHSDYAAAISVRIKVMAGMDIADTRTPQDGRISLTVGTRPVDLRVSTLRTAFGENLVLRVLDRGKGIVPLDELGLADGDCRLLRTIMRRPQGMILVTGPTGSGKTTTLYSMIRQINRDSVNIMTLEDPVEYELPLVRQAPVGDGSRLGFARGIRHLMRQDPDVILVGEIRDAETAEQAFRAAMTGHQVYSTLHAGSALGALPRLLDLGVAPRVLGGNLLGVVAQRLVRRLCPQCRRAYRPGPAEQALVAAAGLPNVIRLFEPTGCAACGHSGYRGRLVVMEILHLGPPLQTRIGDGVSGEALARFALDNGLRPLAHAGLVRVAEGQTSLRELGRVVDLQGLDAT